MTEQTAPEVELKVTEDKPADDSREKILKAAEKHFAEKGLESASVRAITRAAGVNHALINYYFGGKVALYKEVLGRLSAKISAPREALLNELEAKAAGKPIPLEDLISIYIRPFFDDYDNPASVAAAYLRFYGLIYAEPSDATHRATMDSGEAFRNHFLLAFSRTLPHQSHKELVYALGSMIAMVAFWRANTGFMDAHFDSSDETHLDVEDLLDHLVAMGCAIFRANSTADSDPASGSGQQPAATTD